MVILSTTLPCSSKKPLGIFLSTEVTRAFLWFLNLQRWTWEEQKKPKTSASLKKGGCLYRRGKTKTKAHPSVWNIAFKLLRWANNKQQNPYPPAEGGKAVAPHVAVGRKEVWAGWSGSEFRWPELTKLLFFDVSIEVFDRKPLLTACYPNNNPHPMPGPPPAHSETNEGMSPKLIHLRQ